MIKYINLELSVTVCAFLFLCNAPFAQAQILGGTEAPNAKLRLKMSNQAEALLIENMNAIDAELGIPNVNGVVNMSFLSTGDIKNISALPKKEQFSAILEAYRNARIYGGITAASEQFPWQVFIKMRSNEGTFQCGGSIVDVRHVLTAAHCLYDTAGNRFSTNNITVMYGDVEIAWMSDVKITRAILHPDYTDMPRNYNNDIALLRLAKPLSFTTGVGPVVLPAWNGPELSAGVDVTVSGFGKTELGYTSQNLLYADVKYVPKSDCKNSTAYKPEKLYSNMLCAGLPNGKVDACSGDSGGPLTLKGGNNLIGIVSWGRGCGLKNYPGVYTDVSKFIPWINQMIAMP